MKAICNFSIVILCLTIASLTSVIARANDRLLTDMKKMGTDLRQLRTQVANPSLNKSSVRVCDDFQIWIHKAQQIVPDSIANLPLDEQASATSHYKQLLTNLSKIVLRLKADFQHGKNSAAQKEISNMLAVRDQGHNIFAPDDLGVDLNFPKTGLVAHCTWLIGPTLNEQSVLIVNWTRSSDHQPVDRPGGFTVSPVMPSMPEMNSPPPNIAKLQDPQHAGATVVGSYKISEIFTSMAGSWEIQFHVSGEMSALQVEVSAD